MQYSGLLG